MEEFTGKQVQDLKVLVTFVGIFCKERHSHPAAEKHLMALPPEMQGLLKKDIRLCSDCIALLHYAMEKRRKCPLNPKPSCKKCHIHCYGKEYRARIREIMAFSGRHLVLRGRLDLLWHYLF